MLEAIIFDWAGTLVDFGSRAPLQAFIQLFKNNGVDISIDEARTPMGTEKREHITRLLAMPRIAKEWLEVHGKAPSKSDIDSLYEQLIPLQKEEIEKHCTLVPGVIKTITHVKNRNLKIGSTTGYGRVMIENMLIKAQEQGFTADSVVAADEVGRTRPAATPVLQNLVNLKVTSVKHCVKVDDTEPGIAEGLNSGMWTVAVILSGNALGLSHEEWQNSTADNKQRLASQAYQSMETCGAHYHIDSIADLPEVLTDIERRLARGEKP